MTSTTTTVKKSSGTTRRKRTVKSRIVPVESVTKYTEPSKNDTVTETPTSESSSTPKQRRFAPTRPTEPKISLEEYVSDFKVRMQINNYEVMEFLADVVKFYKSAKPVVIQSIDYVKDSYDRAFNQEQDQKEEEKPDSQDR